MLHEWIRVWFGWVGEWGYLGVFGLMALESSIVPVPSEIVMPPAAFWAAQGKGDFWGVVIAGTAGSLFGSLLSYGVARVLGNAFLTRYGRFVGASPEKIRALEGWVTRFGAPGIFLARLLPVVRHLISIPAGILRMPLGRFSLATVGGAGLWCLTLSWFGREVIGSRPELLQSPEAMMAVMKERLHWFVAAILVLCVLYGVMVWLKRRASRGSLAGVTAVVLLAALGTPLIALQSASADEIYTFVVKKQEDKAPNRWSLSEWLETRDKMRVMDLWLALHSPSPYEFYLDGAYQTIQSSPGGNGTGWVGTFAAFATIFGLELGYDALSSAPNLTSALFDLRVFGYHDQATNLTLQAGLRSASEANSAYRNGLGGARLTIYLARHFGIQGLYRHIFDSTPTADGFSLSGDRYEGGAFVDFSFLRVYGNYFSEPDTVALGNSAASVSTTGVQLGARFYF